MEAFVWKFRFDSHPWLSTTVASYLSRPLLSPQCYLDYFDPLSCECRAYARLIQENRTDLAVRAYGYLLLTPGQEAEVCRAESAE
ncbi:hypothetical protein C8A05DRAFT_31137 [Staphylotrichum tortipilum]|uniref:Uncharacterized protein n=1 Tax=Staphylotrichum tortipilum TaxID=2831512 RepID=A0AAN6MRC3_9PEZI|nr:hypothetical protein C8A05DRAFT_31137 [Staphylotrichum longicolle]